jgi:hypothetical protein
MAFQPLNVEKRFLVHKLVIPYVITIPPVDSSSIIYRGQLHPQAWQPEEKSKQQNFSEW